MDGPDARRGRDANCGTVGGSPWVVSAPRGSLLTAEGGDQVSPPPPLMAMRITSTSFGLAVWCRGPTDPPPGQGCPRPLDGVGSSQTRAFPQVKRTDYDFTRTSGRCTYTFKTGRLWTFMPSTYELDQPWQPLRSRSHRPPQNSVPASVDVGKTSARRWSNSPRTATCTGPSSARWSGDGVT